MVFRDPHPCLRLQLPPGCEISGDGVLRVFQGEELSGSLGLQAIQSGHVGHPGIQIELAAFGGGKFKYYLRNTIRKN